MSLRKALLILVSIAVAIVIVSVRNQQRPKLGKEPSEAPAIESTSSAASPTAPVANESTKLPVADFLKRFGSELQISLSPTGKLASVRGRVGQGRPAPGRFDPADPQSAIVRAREILELAAPMLGIEARSPLGKPVAKPGEVSAQVFFKQTFEGAEITPYGNVTVDLGPKGELIALDSDYVEGLTAENRRVIKPEAGGAPVFFVPRPTDPSGRVPGRHANEYRADGKQTVVDAATGKMLFQRDRRKF